MKKLAIVILTFVLLVCVSTRSYGQYIPPKVPEKVCKALDVAVLEAATGKTQASIAEIRELINKYPSWTEPRHQLSRILYDAGNKKEAVTALEESIAIDTFSQLPQLYSLGKLYETVGQFDKALHIYRRVLILGIHQDGLLQKASASLQRLEEKTALFHTGYEITLHPLPAGINTSEPEMFGRWTLDAKSLIFARIVGGQEDLFIAHFDTSGAVDKVEELSFNTNLNEATHTISPDGKYLIFTACNRADGMGSCDLYLSVLKNDVWTEPVNMGPGFNSTSWDSQPAFGLDGTSIYFASGRPGGMGGTDIWMTYEISLGKWSKPINLGPTINTPDNESSPYIHFDGRTMYFMRDGDKGLGGYDLYISRLGIDNKWKTGENLGMPINSGTDEGALAIHPNGKTGLITRLTENGHNDLIQFDLPSHFQSTPVQALQVRLIDKETRKAIHGRVDVFDVKGNDTVRVSQWSDESGNIIITIDKDKSYGLIAAAENYIMHSSHLLPDAGSSRSIEIEMIAVAKAVNQPIALQNIFFETGSAKLLSSSNTELNKLVWTLRNNEKMHIEIRGHTDDVGMDDYNQVLSEERAKAVYSYLVDRGIDASRLSFKGFGETQPVATNESEEGRRQNRRTEFVIQGRFD